MHACAAMPAAPNENKTEGTPGEVVMMGTLSVNIGKYRWWHAKSRHFELLICTDKSDWLVPVVQKTEFLISKLAAGAPLFQLENDLPIKLIYIFNEGLERFDKPTGNRMAAAEAVKTRFEQHTGFNIGLVSPPSTPAQDREQLMVLKNVNHARALGAKMRISLDSSTLLRNYVDRCLHSNNIKTNPKFQSLAKAQTTRRTFSFYGLLFAFAGMDYENAKYNTGPFDLKKDRLVIRRYYKKAAGISIERAPNFKDEYKTADIEAAFFKTPRIGLEEALNTPPQDMLYSKDSVEAREKHILLCRERADFADYCIFGPNPRTHEAFTKLLLANRKIPVTEDVFRECFGTGFKEFHKEMYDFYRSLAKNDRKYKNNAWGPPFWTVAAIKPADMPPP
jgi:hypothetical protein